MSVMATRGGEAGPSTRVLWHFGLMNANHDDGFSSVSNANVSRVLHVDAKEDRLVEITDSRIMRVVALYDLVSYSEEEEEDPEESFLDEEEAAIRLRERTTIAFTIRRRMPFRDATEIREYRLQSLSETRALRVVLERLSQTDPDEQSVDDVSLSPSPGDNKTENVLDCKILKSGTLMRRIGRVALSENDSAKGRGGGRWTTCAALCVTGKLILLSKPPSDGDGSNSNSYGQTAQTGQVIHPPAPIVATGGRASPLSIHAVICLENARVVSRKSQWNDGGGGEFDIVTSSVGRIVLAAPRGGRNERDAWVEALTLSANTANREMKNSSAFSEINSPSPNSKENEYEYSDLLDHTTRATLAEARRIAGAMRVDFGDARDVSDGESDDTSRNKQTETEKQKPQKVLVLDRFWRHAMLGISGHFLWNFSVRVLRYGEDGTAERKDGTAEQHEKTQRPYKKKARRALLHVDVERNAVEAYIQDSVKRKNSKIHNPLVTRSVETAHVDVTSIDMDNMNRHDHRHVVQLTATGFGSFPLGTCLGTFSFQTAADKDVFVSLVLDLKSGMYKNPDMYSFRNLVKRGVESGVSGDDLQPARYLVLVPGKLLVLRGDRTGVPLQTASLAEGVVVTALKARYSSESSSSEQSSPSAIVTLALPHDEHLGFTFRFSTLDAAKSWARALSEAAQVVRQPTRLETPDASTVTGEEGQKADDPDSPLSPGGVPPSPTPPSSPVTPRDAPPSPRHRGEKKPGDKAIETADSIIPTYFDKQVAVGTSLVQSALRDAHMEAENEASEARARLLEVKEADAERERVRHRAETEARGAFAKAEARAEQRLAKEYEQQAAAVKTAMEESARERAGVEAAAKVRAEAKEKLLAAEQARAFAEAEETKRALEEAKAAAKRVRQEAQAKAAALAEAEAEAEAELKAQAAARAKIEAEERAAVRMRVEKERAAIAKIKEEEDAVRRVQSENEFRLAVRARVEAEERERVDREHRARENVRLRLEQERAVETEHARRALEAEKAARVQLHEESLAAERKAAAEAAVHAEKLAEAERRAAAAEASVARAEAERRQAQAEAAAATKARADALAAEVAAAVMAGADPFAATRANSVASPASTRDSPGPYTAYSPYAEEKHFERQLGFHMRATPSADVTPAPSPSPPPPQMRPPPSPPRRMNDAFFSLARRESSLRSLGVLESPPDSPPPASSSFPFRATKMDPRGRPVGRRGDSSSSDSSSSSRSSSPDHIEQSRRASSHSSPPEDNSSPIERLARDVAPPELPPPTPELAFLVSSTIDPSHAEEPRLERQLGFREMTTAEAAVSVAKRAAAAETEPPAAAQGTPNWSALVEENMGRKVSESSVPKRLDRQQGFRVSSAMIEQANTSGVSNTSRPLPSRESTERDRPLFPEPSPRAAPYVYNPSPSEVIAKPVPVAEVAEASSSTQAPPTHFLAAAAARSAPVERASPYVYAPSPSEVIQSNPPKTSDTGSPPKAPPTHFLAAAAARANSNVGRVSGFAPPSPQRKPPQHPRAAPSPTPPVPNVATGPIDKKKKSMIKSMFKGMFKSGGSKKTKK